MKLKAETKNKVEVKVGEMKCGDVALRGTAVIMRTSSQEEEFRFVYLTGPCAGKHIYSPGGLSGLKSAEGVRIKA